MTDNEKNKNQQNSENTGVKRAPARRANTVKKKNESAQKAPAKKQVKPAQKAAKSAPKAQGAAQQDAKNAKQQHGAHAHLPGRQLSRHSG